jgi:hypothetical protein
MHEFYGAIVRDLHAVALTTELPVWLLAHTKRPDSSVRTNRPSLTDFALSSVLDRFVHAAMIVQAKPEGASAPVREYAGVDAWGDVPDAGASHELHVMKNRDGRMFVVDLNFIRPQMRFEDPNGRTVRPYELPEAERARVGEYRARRREIVLSPWTAGSPSVCAHTLGPFAQRRGGLLRRDTVELLAVPGQAGGDEGDLAVLVHEVLQGGGELLEVVEDVAAATRIAVARGCCSGARRGDQKPSSPISLEVGQLDQLGPQGGNGGMALSHRAVETAADARQADAGDVGLDPARIVVTKEPRQVVGDQPVDQAAAGGLGDDQPACLLRGILQRVEHHRLAAAPLAVGQHDPADGAGAVGEGLGEVVELPVTPDQQGR